MQLRSIVPTLPSPTVAAHPLARVRDQLDASIDSMHDREFADASYQAGAALLDAVAGLDALGDVRTLPGFARLRDDVVGDTTWLVKVTMAAREISELTDGRLGPDAAAYAEQRIRALTDHADQLHRTAVAAIDGILALR